MHCIWNTIRVFSCVIMLSSVSVTIQADGDLEAKKSAKALGNEEWKIVDMDDLCVKKGSALDMSGLAPRQPAGSFGRVILDKTGHCVFEQKPDMRLRFFGATGDGSWDLLGDRPDKATIERLADTMMHKGTTCSA